MIKSNSPVGEYEISIKNTNDNNIFLEPISFKLRAESAEEKAVPAWVKNNAGWWASDTISDAEFVAALQFLVKEGIITTQHHFTAIPKKKVALYLLMEKLYFNLVFGKNVQKFIHHHQNV